MRKSPPAFSRLSPCTSDGLKSTRRKRKRPTRPLPPTLRETLRFYPEKLHQHQTKSWSEQTDHLLNVAQSRIGWMRNQIFSFWNPERGQQAAKAVQGGAGDTKESLLTLERIQRFQTNQNGIIMDFRWWFWNILFALSPAMLIGGYCELRGKHVMYEYHQNQELAQMKRVMGEEWCAQNAERILKAQKDRDADLSDRIFAAIQDLYRLSIRQFFDVFAISPSSITHDLERSPTSHSTISTNAQPAVPVYKGDDPLELTGDKTIDALIRKVQQLEAKLGSNNLDDRLRRVQQSGISNRVEDSMVQKWQKLLEQETNDTARTKTGPSFADMILEQLSASLEELAAIVPLNKTPATDQDGPSEKSDDEQAEDDTQGRSKIQTLDPSKSMESSTEKRKQAAPDNLSPPSTYDRNSTTQWLQKLFQWSSGA